MMKLYYFYYRWRYEIPHPNEIFSILTNLIEEPTHSWIDIVIEYSTKQKIEDVAQMHRVTRERVRQLVWKFWRLYKF